MTETSGNISIALPTGAQTTNIQYDSAEHPDQYSVWVVEKQTTECTSTCTCKVCLTNKLRESIVWEALDCFVIKDSHANDAFTEYEYRNPEHKGKLRIKRYVPEDSIPKITVTPDTDKLIWKRSPNDLEPRWPFQTPVPMPSYPGIITPFPTPTPPWTINCQSSSTDSLPGM